VKLFSSKQVFDFSSDNRQSKIGNPKWVGLVAFVIAFALCGAVGQTQQPGKIFRIGFLDGSTAAVWQFSWTRSARAAQSSVGLKERISPSNTIRGGKA
jgi:hypothetical protein